MPRLLSIMLQAKYEWCACQVDWQDVRAPDKTPFYVFVGATFLSQSFGFRSGQAGQGRNAPPTGRRTDKKWFFRYS